MKKLTAIIISLLIVAGLLPSGVISAESGYAGYEETLLTEPGFTADCYYKIYDTNGKALTYARTTRTERSSSKIRSKAKSVRNGRSSAIRPFATVTG